jgi:hypothetical protein
VRGRRGRDILVALERTLDTETKVLGLSVGQGLELDVDMVEMKTGNLLVEDLGEHIDLLLELAALGELDVLLAESLVVVLEQHDLSKHLVGEAARHDEGAVASGTSKVDETSLGEEDDMTARLHQVTVNLRLDVLVASSVGLDPRNINLNVEVANV